MIQQNLLNPWQRTNLRQGRPALESSIPKSNIPDNMQWEHSAQKEESAGSGESDCNDNSDSDKPEEDFDELTSTTQKQAEK